MQTLNRFLRVLGPGLLYAGAAIGVSHIVQSTRAGASYGFQLVWVIILANLLKYPFFELGPRFAAVTGKSLLEGYESLGRWALPLFLLMTMASMFITIAAITLVTAGIFQSIFNLPYSTVVWCFVTLGVSVSILLNGHYAVLDRITKFVVLLLSLTTLTAVILVFSKQSNFDFKHSNQFVFHNKDDLFFLLAFMGWMPAPIEISVWHSLWTLENKKLKNDKISLKEVLTDFNVGFWGTIILALAFVSLGACLMYPTGIRFSPQAIPFSEQFIGLYTKSIGDWTYPIVAFSALATMFSTMLTCLDAYPRVTASAMNLWIGKWLEQQENRSASLLLTYRFWMGVIVLGSGFNLLFLTNNMKTLVDFATFVAFIFAPVLAGMNLMCAHKHRLKWQQLTRPFWLVALSHVGMVYLVGFSLYFILIQFITL
ncbi:MAG: Nramp family divalent metal transporter [Oligoflexales bacterium]